MKISEHDGTEIVSVSLTKDEAQVIVQGLTLLIGESHDEHYVDIASVIRLVLMAQIIKWDRL